MAKEKAKEIVILGNCNRDFIGYSSRFPGPGETFRGYDFQQVFGGKGANQAVMCGRLARGEFPVSLISKVGQDSIGAETRANLESNHISCDHIFVSDTKASGVALINVVEDDGSGRSNNNILVVGGANEDLSDADIRKCDALLQNCALFVCQLECLVVRNLEAMRLAKAGGAWTILNPSPVPGSTAKLAEFEQLLELTDILVPNEVELSQLSQSSGSLSTTADVVGACATLGKRFGKLQYVVCTVGERGAVLVDLKRKCTHDTAPAPCGVDAVDTSGAGDCFLGAFAYAFVKAEKKDVDLAFLKDCAEYGCRAAAISVGRKGTQSSFPEKEEVV